LLPVVVCGIGLYRRGIAIFDVDYAYQIIKQALPVLAEGLFSFYHGIYAKTHKKIRIHD